MSWQKTSNKLLLKCPFFLVTGCWCVTGHQRCWNRSRVLLISATTNCKQLKLYAFLCNFITDTRWNRCCLLSCFPYLTLCRNFVCSRWTQCLCSVLLAVFFPVWNWVNFFGSLANECTFLFFCSKVHYPLLF